MQVLEKDAVLQAVSHSLHYFAIACLRFVDAVEHPAALRLAVEYPGYGLHQGTPNPESIEVSEMEIIRWKYVHLCLLYGVV